MTALFAAAIVAIVTTAGEIDVRVDTVHAPKTAANFLSYVRRGFFDGGTFFRTVTTHPDNQPGKRVKIDVIQATHNARAHKHLDPPVVFEPTSQTGLHHLDGTVSMARDDAPNTAQTDFFICIGPQPGLDDGGRRSKDHHGFAAFGQVVRGMDVVRAIHDRPQHAQHLTPAVDIIRHASLSDRVLLVIDVQTALVDWLEPRRRGEFLNVLTGLIARARDAGTRVVYVRQGDEELLPGTPGWEIAAEVAPHAGDPIVDKRFRDAFRETDLADVLARESAQHLVLSGMQTDYCVDATLREAERRGYRVTLAADAHATYPAGGLSEGQIRDNMHRIAVGLAEIVPSAEVFAER